MTNRNLRHPFTPAVAVMMLLAAGLARAAEPNVTPAVTGPANATVGEPYNYTLAVSNIGSAATRGPVTVTDPLAPSLTINSVSTNANFACDIAGKTVTCTTKAAIGAGAATVPVATINVTPTVAGAVDNSISVAGGGDASAGDNKTWPITTSVALPPRVVVAAAEVAPTPVPSLSPPMLMLLGTLLALGSGLALRARRGA